MPTILTQWHSYTVALEAVALLAVPSIALSVESAFELIPISLRSLCPWL
jgi:ABC-type phosphate transport system permease subunit